MITSVVPVVMLPPTGPARSEGVHLSSIIRCIATETGILKPEWVEELSLIEVKDNEAWWLALDATARLRISIGLAWEQWYLPQLQGVTKHPGEMCLEGIYMTPDGESIDLIVTERGPRNMLAIHEVKATYKSLKTVAPRRLFPPETIWTPDSEVPNDLETQWMWLAQTKGYCKAAGSRLAYLHVLFLCGDYSWPMRPQLGPLPDQLSCWRIDYTQEELDQEWSLLVDYKNDFLART